jgi:type VI secretion system protein ImpH
LFLGAVSVVRPATFLPGRHGLRELSALVRLYTNDEWTWQLRLLLLPADIPRIRLGTAGRLGWTTWLGTRAGIADDVVVQGK